MNGSTLLEKVDAAPVSLDRVSALLSGLNREQRQAVTHGTGPQLVLAGPGTGKTEVITRRVAWLIATKRARPSEILALTFTEKAASQMQTRVDLLVPYGQADAAIHTFHAFGDRVLREHAFELGLPGDLRLLSRGEAIVLLREHLFTLGLERYRPLGDPTRFLGALVDLFLRAKDEGVEPERFELHARSLLERARLAAPEEREALADLAAGQAELAAAYRCYQRLLLERGLIDHADQVLLCVRLLRERPAVRRLLHDRYRYLLVDEFQDTNPAQLELVLGLAGANRNVTVVGDDDQAIYAFRGAAVSNMRRFIAAQPGLSRVVLRRNYRSRAPVVEASQRLIRHNDPQRLASLDGFDKEPMAVRRSRSPAPVRQLSFLTREQEADG
ncbi:MAG: UvrD-helicase domain-containing protein, partial [Chloroflexota bacterium]|nr:UvrD-helicase domain-containing protein [Chloroflexota bacterium]